MDADGEDDPGDVPRLIQRCREEAFEKIVFAERTRRSESLAFRVFYGLYKTLHVMLTGIRVRVGNFSVIPRARLQSLVVVSEMWNHYAAAAFKSRQPLCLVPTRRADRLSGRSRMNFVDLVAHGLGAMSVYGEIIGVRLLVLACLLIFAALAGAAATVIVRLTTNLAIPGWATSTARHPSDHLDPGHHAGLPVLLRHPLRPPGIGLPSLSRLRLFRSGSSSFAGLIDR